MARETSVTLGSSSNEPANDRNSAQNKPFGRAACVTNGALGKMENTIERFHFRERPIRRKLWIGFSFRSTGCLPFSSRCDTACCCCCRKNLSPTGHTRASLFWIVIETEMEYPIYTDCVRDTPGGRKNSATQRCVVGGVP